jgi:hypothetical protein
MNSRKLIVLVAALVTCSLPCALSAQLGNTTPAMSPAERAKAQARLQAQAAEVFNVPIDTARGLLRAAIVPLRDTLQTVDANAERIVRANATGMSAVVRSSGRVLARQCLGSDSVAGATFEKINGMRTSNAKGDQLITNYRAAITHLRGTLADCQQRIGAELAEKKPDLAVVMDQVRSVDRAVREHDAAMQALTDGLQIFLMPKGYIPPRRDGGGN